MSPVASLHKKHILGSATSSRSSASSFAILGYSSTGLTMRLLRDGKMYDTRALKTKNISTGEYSEKASACDDDVLPIDKNHTAVQHQHFKDHHRIGCQRRPSETAERCQSAPPKNIRMCHSTACLNGWCDKPCGFYFHAWKACQNGDRCRYCHHPAHFRRKGKKERGRDQRAKQTLSSKALGLES